MKTISAKASGSQCGGQVKARWGKLTHADLKRAEGKSLQLIGLLQEMYSCTREHAEVEFKRRLQGIDAH